MNPSRFKGWAQLRPMYECRNGSQVPFHFPLGTPGRYEIGSRRSDTVSFLLPEQDQAEQEEQLQIEAILVVKAEGEVFMERPAGPNRPVRIDGVVINPGQASLEPLTFGTTVSFDQIAYIFLPSSDFYNERFLEKMIEIRQCQVCTGVSDSILVLACGHNICGKCRREGTRQTPPVRFGRPHHLGSLHAQQAGPPHVPMHCSACKTRVSVGVATSALSSVTISQTVKLVSDLERLAGNLPLCEDCQNKRGMIDVRDYRRCETCQRLLCPMCILEWHRNHQLEPRADRLQSLDTVDHKLVGFTRSLAIADRDMKRILSDQKIGSIIANGQHLGTTMRKAVRALEEKLLECQQQLGFIQLQRRALGHGWNEANRETGNAFGRLLDEFQEKKRWIERVRDGEESLTLSQSSDETNTTDGTASTTSTSQTQSTTTGTANASVTERLV